MGRIDSSRLIRPSTWTATVRDLRTGRVLHQERNRNNILTLGNLALARQIYGLDRKFAPYIFVEIGSSGKADDPTLIGCDAPILDGSGAAVRATNVNGWSDTGGGSPFSLGVSFSGALVTGEIRESALYNVRSGGKALYRVVYQAPLVLSSLSVLDIVVTVDL